MGNSLAELEKNVEELEKQMKEVMYKKSVKIKKELGIGDVFDLAGLKWKILDITEKGYFCLSENFYGENRVFDSDSSDWKTSSLRKKLNSDLVKEIEKEIGEENLVKFERNLFSLDGQTEYGICEDKVSIISVDEYRKYRKLIPNTKEYWWTLTPWSTPCNNYETSMAVVCPSGCIYGSDSYYDVGVRPVCIFSSSIFKSEDK